ncbi:MAG: hypothetical protein IPG86_06900 [Chitinophagaceae bacterium]|jgi:hypothetical protein|nr:hypothetical protein [Chitinophagaceae bacterium]
MSTKDPFERFIRDNRSEFDSEIPGKKVWEQLESSLPMQKQVRRFTRNELMRWTAAAAILVAILTSIYFLYIKNSHEQQTVSGDQLSKNPVKGLEETGSMNPEYAVLFKQVSVAVQTRQEQLKAAANGLPELYQQFEKDLAVLDSSFRSLRQQAGQTPNRDVLIRAMIQNLQLQSELLERQLQVIQEFKQPQKTNNEKTI